MEKDFAADGLRGIAAVNVVIAHFVVAFFPLGAINLFPGIATDQAQPNIVNDFFSLPIISIFWNGHFAVCVFFVLSGYVLTKSFLATGDINILRLRAARRYFRLTVPILASVLLAYVVLILGFDSWEAASQISHSLWLGSYWEFEPNLYDAIWQGLIGAIFIGESSYMPPLWTMKIEFIGSMLVFSYRAICFEDRREALFLPIVLLAIYFVFPKDWIFYFGFLAGSYIGKVRPSQNQVTVCAFLVLGIFFGAFDYSPIYDWTHAIPLSDLERKSFFNILGGACLLYAVRSGSSSKFLLSGVAQFLGRISYSIYLVHFVVLFTFSSWLYTFLHSEMNVHILASLAINLISSVLVILFLATVFDYVFDRSGIALSKWIFRGRSQDLLRYKPQAAKV